MTRFTAGELEMLRMELNLALERLPAGYAAKAGHISYTDTGATIKVELCRAGEDPLLRKMSDALKIYCPWAVGKSLAVNGKQMEIVGYKSRCRAPVVLRDPTTGKLWRGALSSIEHLKESS